MIAFKDFFRRKAPPPIRLPQPSVFVIVRGADAERIDARFDASGKRLLKLVVYTRSR